MVRLTFILLATLCALRAAVPPCEVLGFQLAVSREQSNNHLILLTAPC